MLLVIDEYRSMCMLQAFCYALLVQKLQTPLNHSVVFVKEDMFLTINYWRIIVNFELSAYEDATTTLHEDISQMETITKRTIPIGELRHVETALTSL
jgi:hypothetical protein